VVVAAVELPARDRREAASPRAAAFLNLTPDHLDRYANVEAYGAAKLKLAANLVGDDVAVINAGRIRFFWPPRERLAPTHRAVRKASRARAHARRQQAHSSTASSTATSWYALGERYRIDRRAAPRRPPQPRQRARRHPAHASGARISCPTKKCARRWRRSVRCHIACSSVRGKSAASTVLTTTPRPPTSTRSVAGLGRAFTSAVSLLIAAESRQGRLVCADGRHHARQPLPCRGGSSAKPPTRSKGRCAKILRSTSRRIVRASSMDDAVARARRRRAAGRRGRALAGVSSYDMFDNYEHRGRAIRRRRGDAMKEATATTTNLRRRRSTSRCLIPRVAPQHDIVLFAAVLALVGFGIVMVYSASAVYRDAEVRQRHLLLPPRSAVERARPDRDGRRHARRLRRLPSLVVPRSVDSRRFGICSPPCSSSAARINGGRRVVPRRAASRSSRPSCQARASSLPRLLAAKKAEKVRSFTVGFVAST